MPPKKKILQRIVAPAVAGLLLGLTNPAIAAPANFFEATVGGGVSADFSFTDIPTLLTDDVLLRRADFRCFDTNAAASTASNGVQTTATCPPGSEERIDAGAVIEFAFGTTRGGSDIGSVFANSVSNTFGLSAGFVDENGLSASLTIEPTVEELFLRMSSSNDTFAVNNLSITFFDGSGGQLGGADARFLGAAAVPLPAPGIMLLGGLLMVAGLRRRRVSHKT